MKYTITLLIFGLSFLKINAQVTFEHSYPGPNSSSWARLQLINLGKDEYKYVIVDFPANTITLYNMDHSVYKSIKVPVTLENESENNVGYISRSLFDCDDEKIEYAILPQSGKHDFYIYREDGTVLFQRENTIAPYCLGCFGGSYDVRPIVNTPQGAKLFLLQAEPGTGAFLKTDVYKLCGQLPTEITETKTDNSSYVKVYPNPSTGIPHFQVDLPSNIQNYEIRIYNASGQPVQSLKAQRGNQQPSFENMNLSSGLYLFTLQADGKVIQNGKFVIEK